MLSHVSKPAPVLKPYGNAYVRQIREAQLAASMLKVFTFQLLHFVPDLMFLDRRLIGEMAGHADQVINEHGRKLLQQMIHILMAV